MDITLYLVLSCSFSIVNCLLHQEPEVSLSPALWDPETFQRLESISLKKNPRPKPLVFSDGQGMVSGTTSVFSVHAGIEALRKGGNAMDACIATAMSDIPLTAGSEASYAGVTNILYYHQVTGRTHNLDAAWKIPKLKDKTSPDSEASSESILVPGMLAGIHEAAEFARFSLRTLLEPALYFAEKGFKMTHKLSRKIQKHYKKLLTTSNEGKEIFTNPKTGSPYMVGEIFRQRLLAEFIRNIQKQGKAYMYQGRWATKFINAIHDHGGKMSFKDMENYESRWREPLSILYSGYHVTTSGSEWGGTELMEMLGLLKLADLGKTKDSYLTNATKLISLMSISRFSSFISDYLHAKLDSMKCIEEFFKVDASPTGRKSSGFAQVIWSYLCNDEGRAMVNEYINELLSDTRYFDSNRDYKRGSSGVVAIDNRGNICSLSHTANSRPWGTGLFVEGIALPNAGDVFKDLVINLPSGSFIPSGLQPVIIFKEKLVASYDNQVHNISKKTVIRATKELVEPVMAYGTFDKSTSMKKRFQLKKNKKTYIEEPFRESKEPVSHDTIDIQTNTEKLTRKVRVTEKPVFKWEKVFYTKRLKKLSIKRQITDVPHVEEDPIAPYTPKPFKVAKKKNKEHGERPDTPSISKAPYFGPVIRSRNVSGEKKIQKLVYSADQRPMKRKNMVGHGYQRYRKFRDAGNDSKYHIFSEKRNDNSIVTRKLDQEFDSHTIGGLFTDKDINSILGKGSKFQRLINYRRNWFRNFVYRIFQRQKITENRQGRKLYNRRKHRRWKNPFTALAVIGRSAPEMILQYINNLIDNGMNAKQASEAPMFFSSSPGSLRQNVRVERYIFSDEVIREVRARGQEVNEVLHKVGKVISGKGAVVTTTERHDTYGSSHPDCEGFAESQ